MEINISNVDLTNDRDVVNLYYLVKPLVDKLVTEHKLKTKETGAPSEIPG